MTRRGFAGLLAGTAASGLSQGPRYDIVIRGGEVRDPRRGFKARADVAILDGKIAAIEEQIAPETARDAVDARGLYVVPGLIDLHTHCYWGATDLGVEPDREGARSGVTTWVDAGSFGYDTFHGFRRFIVERSQARVYAYVYLYPNSRNPDIDVVPYVRGVMKRTGETAAANRDVLLGVKVQVGRNMQGRYSAEFLKIARELCDAFRIPMMAHISFAPPETPEVMALMKPGDVVTHCYNTHTLGLVDEAGKLKAGVKEAQARGVVFDIGHGGGSFNFAAARRCLDAGLVCDTISTDVFRTNLNGPVYDLPTTMSKMLYLGMSFDDVLLRSTWNPAKVVGRVEGLGTLRLGGPADVALLAVEDGDFELVDAQLNRVRVKQRIASRLAIARGRRLLAPV